MRFVAALWALRALPRT